MIQTDETWMQRALALAEQGRGHVEPNPLVGAVIVRDGQVVGEAGTEIRRCECRGRLPAAAARTRRPRPLYVATGHAATTARRRRAPMPSSRPGSRASSWRCKIRFPRVAGQGGPRRREPRGLPEFGLARVRGQAASAPYFKLLADGRPYVHAKWAMTLDGKIATRTGDSKWISNEASRRVVHTLRGRMDGPHSRRHRHGGWPDDPLLTARPPGPRTACRVVLDAKARLPLESQLVRTACAVPAAVRPARQRRRRRLQHCAAWLQVLVVPAADNGRPAILPLLAELGRRRLDQLAGGRRCRGAWQFRRPCGSSTRPTFT